MWPNLIIASDGYQTALVSDRSQERRATFRYFGASTTLIPAKTLEAAIDSFLSDILGRLDSDGIHRTNLHCLWNEVTTERQEPETAFLRRMEARLGCDPDELDQLELSRRWLGDAGRLGKDALEELAADAAYSGAHTDVMSADHITEIAHSLGFDAGREDAVELEPCETGVAWQIGEDYARRLQIQEGFDAKNGNVRYGSGLNTSVARRIASARPTPMAAPVENRRLIRPPSSSHELMSSSSTGTAAE